MSGITPIDAKSGYAPDRLEQRREDAEPVNAEPKVDNQAQAVQAAEKQQDQKTTVQGFQYTGKGSFIDRIF